MEEVEVTKKNFSDEQTYRCNSNIPKLSLESAGMLLPTYYLQKQQNSAKRSIVLNSNTGATGYLDMLSQFVTPKKRFENRIYFNSF